MTRGQLPNIPTPGPTQAPEAGVTVTSSYDGTCDACGAPATRHGWVMAPDYDMPTPGGDIIVARSGWCEQMSCQRDLKRWPHVLDREPAWEGLNS